MVGEIERLLDEGASRSEIAVLYRTNAMSRVIEDTLVRREIAYQVIGGTKFYERAEIKDAIAYLSLLANPFDVVSFTRVANSPRRGIGQTSLARIIAPRDRDGHLGVGGRRRARSRFPASARRRSRRWGASWPRWPSCGDDRRELPAAKPTAAARKPCRGRCGLRGAAAPIAELLEAVLAQSGYVEALEAERTIEAQGRIENLEQLVEVGREFDARRAEGDGTLERFLQEVALVADADARSRRRGPGDADDAAQREGPRVPDRVHHRLRGRRLPALPRARRGRPGGGAPPVLRRA